MHTIAYLSNEFPSPVEPYVVDEVRELRKRGVNVIPCSARRPATKSLPRELAEISMETLYLQPLQLGLMLTAVWVCAVRWTIVADFFRRAAIEGNEPVSRRLRALLHTLLGVYFALLLRDRQVQHIHVHHGYFSSWIAMVAARLLGIGFSMTLHGSDLLLHAAYLDLKVKRCDSCFTVSDYNRTYILEHYPGIDRGKVLVQHLGVDPAERILSNRSWAPTDRLVMFAAGRLHAVKDHAFLVHACRRLKDRGTRVLCLIGGEGRERPALETLIQTLGLQDDVKLLGHVPRSQLDSYYSLADVVVLTSRSEGIPVVLMEAMALARTVLAPAITGIPELVMDGETGFLYRVGSLDDFVERVEMIRYAGSSLEGIRQAARRHVAEHFNRQTNLTTFVDSLVGHLAGETGSTAYANSLLQQI